MDSYDRMDCHATWLPACLCCLETGMVYGDTFNKNMHMYIWYVHLTHERQQRNVSTKESSRPQVIRRTASTIANAKPGRKLTLVNSKLVVRSHGSPLQDGEEPVPNG